MKPVLLVGLGGDIGVYAFARAAHEKYGWDALMVAKQTTTFMRYARLPQWRYESDIHNPETLLKVLGAVAADHPDHELVIFTNLDWHVRVLAQHRDRMSPRWHVPLCDLGAFDRISSKTSFAAAATAVGVRTPLTIDVGFTADAVARGATPAADAVAWIGELGLSYPLIGKPSTSADWFDVSFPGKQKIHHLESEAQLTEVLTHLTAANYPSEFLVQEFVPGDETHMRSLTAYRDTQGRVALLAGGQVLLEEHTPGTLGIPAAILTGVDDQAFADASRILEQTDYYGFANFDYKIHRDSGERVFFEANPRIGRNNFYVTSAGVNVADVVARDLLPEHWVAANPGDAVGGEGPTLPQVAHGEILYSVVPYRLLLKYILDPDLRERVKAAKRNHGVFHPLKYGADASPKRRAYVAALGWRLRRKYKEYYPKPTESGF